MQTTISIANIRASMMPILVQLLDSTSIYLVNSKGCATCVYVDEELDSKTHLGDIIQDFCKSKTETFSEVLPDDIDLTIAKILPIGTQVTLTQS